MFDLQGEKWMVRCCEAERYIEMAVEKACEMVANQNLKDAPSISKMENSVPHDLPPTIGDHQGYYYPSPLTTEAIKVHVGHEEDFTGSLQLQKFSLNSSIDGYLVSLGHSPSSVPSGEAGSARLRVKEEDPASTYLNLMPSLVMTRTESRRASLKV
ncbi:hypothetical protein Acr_19g0005200 [Actinidia rufa]|uniref:Uncharacterized protein n=1 Tax=Actinidia rufa TaxID=165716 RepID=A0A7J0G9X8_9ERIC|nr:hypothetical protein Acr_19g0005200 [Actinidia rufa]